MRSESEVFDREWSSIVEFQLRELGASHGFRNTKVQPASRDRVGPTSA